MSETTTAIIVILLTVAGVLAVNFAVYCIHEHCYTERQLATKVQR